MAEQDEGASTSRRQVSMTPRRLEFQEPRNGSERQAVCVGINRVARMVVVLCILNWRLGTGVTGFSKVGSCICIIAMATRLDTRERFCIILWDGMGWIAF